MKFALIGSRTLPFFDDCRNRPILTELFYPVAEQASLKHPFSANIWRRFPEARNARIMENAKPYPLILFSHGNAGSRIENVWLIHVLVQSGYLVASIDHFGNTWDLNEVEESWKRWNRAQDISFVIRKILQSPEFSSCIHEDRIGFCGFSLGGLTGLWLAGAQANLIEKALQKEPEILRHIDLTLAKGYYRDHFVKAAFLMAPAYGSAFDQVSLANISIPTYITIGKRDKIVRKQEAQYLKNSIPNCTLKILGGWAGHFVFINKPTILGKILLPKNMILDHLTTNITKVQQTIAEEARLFFNKHLAV